MRETEKEVLNPKENKKETVEVDTKVNLIPTKIIDGYAECEVRLVVGQKK